MAGYVVKIVIENTHPPVWRRILVPEKITFSELHEMIQIIFGWEDEHLHEFSIPSEYINIGNMEEGRGRYYYNEEETLVELFLFDYKWIRYTYDFGDEWRHKIIYEKTDEDYDKRYASLLKFKGDNFLEDSGGVWTEADEGENRGAFDKVLTEQRLEKLDCPCHDELLSQLEEPEIDEELFKTLHKLFQNFCRNAEIFNESTECPAKVSKMTEKVDSWKNCAESCTVEIVKGGKTNAELLKDLGVQEAKDYCKYLRLPTNSLYLKEQLTDLIAQTFREHPEYILYVFYEKEYKELLRWIKSSEEMRKNVFREPDVVIKALDLGLLDIGICREKENDCVKLSFASDLPEIIRPLDGKCRRQIYRKLAVFSKRLESYILFYGIFEIDSLYKEFCENFQMAEKEDFYRCVYWYARFNNLVQTMFAIDGKSYVASTQLDAERIFLDVKKYADDLEYAFRPAKELEFLTEEINGRSIWIEVLFVDLHFKLGFSAEEAGYIIEEIFKTIMNGAVLSEVLGIVYALPRSDSLERACIVASEDLSTLCGFWLCITGLMLELELPMLKGRSRKEYAQETGISPWNVGMLEQKKISGDSQKRHMYEFPADVQERMYRAVNYADTEESEWLSKYKRDQKIKSEEFLALLADAYITCSEFGKASKLIDELERSSARAHEAAQILKMRLEEGRDVMDEEDDIFPFPMDNWDFEPEYKPQPYARETRKIGRNEPCPCGSGKKYKHCCGKK